MAPQKQIEMRIQPQRMLCFLPPPPRVARDDPSRAFEEIRIYATQCGTTPTRGKGKSPKKKNWEEDQRRLHNCTGNLFKIDGDERNPCYLCNTKTSFLCIGCKRWYCIKSRYKKIHQLILNKNEVVGFLNEKCPPSTFNIKAVAEDGTISSFRTEWRTVAIISATRTQFLKVLLLLRREVH